MRIIILISNNRENRGVNVEEYERLILICFYFFIMLVILALKWYYVMAPIH